MHPAALTGSTPFIGLATFTDRLGTNMASEPAAKITPRAFMRERPNGMGSSKSMTPPRGVSPPPQSMFSQPESVRRVADWEREVETLDKKEVEIHQSQLRILRDQASVVRSDIMQLRQELLDVRAALAQHAAVSEDASGRLNELENNFKSTPADFSRTTCLADRVTFLEGSLGESVDGPGVQSLETMQYGVGRPKQTSSLERHAPMRERLTYLEKLLGDSADKHGREVEALRGAHDKYAKDFQQRQERLHATLQERLAFLERAQGDSAEKHIQEIRAAHDKIDRVGTQTGAVDSLKSNHAQLSSQMERQHASTNERLDFLERTVGESADRHAREIEGIKTSHSKLQSDGKTHAQASGKIAALLSSHSSLEERIKYVEGLIGDNADKHSRELQSLKAATGTHSAGIKDATLKHSSLEERLVFLEKTLGDSADKHSTSIQDVHFKVERLTKTGDQVEGVKKGQDAHAKQLAQHAEHHSTTNQRLDYLERLLGDSADRHGKEIEALKSAHGKIQSENRGHGQNHGVLSQKVEALLGNFGTHDDKINQVGRQLADHVDRNGKEITLLKATQQSQGATQKEIGDRQATFEQRIHFLENELGDSAEKHAVMLATQQQKLDQLHGKMAEERREREKHGEALNGHKEKQTQHHVSVEDRLNYLEKFIGDSAEKHNKEIEAVKGSHARIVSDNAAKHHTLEDRLAHLEKWHLDFRKL